MFPGWEKVKRWLNPSVYGRLGRNITFFYFYEVSGMAFQGTAVSNMPARAGFNSLSELASAVG